MNHMLLETSARLRREKWPTWPFISEQGVAMDMEKVPSMLDLPPPKNEGTSGVPGAHRIQPEVHGKLRQDRAALREIVSTCHDDFPHACNAKFPLSICSGNTSGMDLVRCFYKISILLPFIAIHWVLEHGSNPYTRKSSWQLWWQFRGGAITCWGGSSSYVQTTDQKEPKFHYGAESCWV